MLPNVGPHINIYMTLKFLAIQGAPYICVCVYIYIYVYIHTHTTLIGQGLMFC
jgi:hypothetical protein